MFPVYPKGDPGENCEKMLSDAWSDSKSYYFNNSPTEVLVGPCDFIVAHFNHRLKSTLESPAPLPNQHKLKLHPPGETMKF